jgi:glycosyltransferase involved in cell wall biosynthesis
MAQESATDRDIGQSVEKHLFFLDGWGLGGSSVFNANLGASLRRLHGYIPSGFSLGPIDENNFAKGLIGFPVQGGNHRRLTRKRMLQDGYQAIRELKPNRLICTIHSWNCEMARHLPAHVVKIGVVHAVDPDVIAMAQRYSEYFDAIVSVSEVGLAMLTGMTPPLRCPCHFIPPGILMPDEGWNRQPNLEQPLRLLYLGRVTEPSKRARSIVGIAKALKASGVPFQWTIAGDGDEGDFVAQGVAEAGVSEVVMLGTVNHKEVPGLFATHDVIVSTSEREAFPLALQEAMAHGLVPVAAAAPGRVKDVVTAAGGFLVGVDDSNGFCEAILALAKDRDLLARLSAQATAGISKDLGWESIAMKWQALLASPAMQPRLDTGWSERLDIQPSMNPLFPGCPVWIKDAFDSLLSSIERLDAKHVRRIRRLGYAVRRRLFNR